jgi:TRAP-type transport system periplasmic protein
MRKVSVILLVSMFFVLLTACSQGTTSKTSPGKDSSNGGEKVTLRIAHTTSESHPYHQATVKFADLVKEKTDGRVDLTIYSAGQLGTDTEILEQTMNGELDGALVGLSNFSGFTPVLDSLQLPFLIDNYALEKEVLNLDVTRELLDSLHSSLGLKGLTMFEGGMMHVATTDQKVVSPSDLKGLKLRVTPSNLTRDVFNTFGASPTPIAFPEIYSALQTNVIDGEQINLTSMVSEKHYEVIKNVTILGEFPFPGVVVFNSDLFGKLSETDQQAVQEAALEASDFNLTQMQDLDKEALKVIEDQGITVTNLSDEQKQVFVDNTEGIYGDYFAKDPLIEKFVNEVKKLKNK